MEMSYAKLMERLNTLDESQKRLRKLESEEIGEKRRRDEAVSWMKHHLVDAEKDAIRTARELRGLLQHPRVGVEVVSAIREILAPWCGSATERARARAKEERS